MNYWVLVILTINPLGGSDREYEIVKTQAECELSYQTLEAMPEYDGSFYFCATVEDALKLAI